MRRILIEIGVSAALSIIGVLQRLVTKWLESKTQGKHEGPRNEFPDAES